MSFGGGDSNPTNILLAQRVSPYTITQLTIEYTLSTTSNVLNRPLQRHGNNPGEDSNSLRVVVLIGRIENK